MYADVFPVDKQPRRRLVIQICRQQVPRALPLLATEPSLAFPRVSLWTKAHRSVIVVRRLARFVCSRARLTSLTHRGTSTQDRERRRRCRSSRRDPRGLQNRLQLARPHHRVHFRNVLLDLVAIALHQAPGDHNFLARPSVLWRTISRIVSTDSCLAVSIKLQVFTTSTSASSGRPVSRAPARSSSPIITSESTRFFGQPNEIKPTVGAVGWGTLLTPPLYREVDFLARYPIRAQHEANQRERTTQPRSLRL